MSSSTTPAAPPTTAAPASSSSSSSTTNHLLVLSYVTIVSIWTASQFILIPYVVHLLTLVTAILYAACHGSLLLREEVVDEASGKVVSKNSGETMKKEDALQFPILGSASLLGLYLAFKFLDPQWVNLLIGLYFGTLGALALTATVDPWLNMLPGSSKHFHFEKRHVPLLGHVLVDFTVTEAVAFAASAVFCYYYLMTKHWAMNNVLGICFCIQAIERFSLGTYKIAAILLIGLFFYDIFWVFGTDVMVTVAKSLDGPIKILFPRSSLEPNPETGKLDLSLLGLGDIVIPGFFLSLLLRFDAHNAHVPKHVTDLHADFPKPYFTAALLSYVLGLATTLFVMIQFNAAQPALLYLVPACLGSSWICAVVRGELKELFAYSEEQDEEEEEEEAKEGESKKED